MNDLRPASPMSAACPWCFKRAEAKDARGVGASVYQHDVDEPGGPAVRMLWHMDCVAPDTILDAIATANGAPDGDEEASERNAELHDELHQRIYRQGGLAALRACIHVERDFGKSRGLTLRHPRMWGAPVSTTKHNRRR